MEPEARAAREAEEQRIQRVVAIAVVVVAALVGTALVALGPDAAPSRTVAVAAAADGAVTTTTASSATTTTSTTSRTPTTTAAATPSSTVTSSTAPGPSTTDPGALPQTDDHPSSSGATFTAGVNGLWQAIRQDRPELGLPFFFPERAYLQVKDISDPAGDYQNRLVANYQQDIHTLHAQLGPDAANATFVGIDVPDDQAVWVQPGAEYNKGSYWRVYGSTMQYEVDGQRRSFPVTSLISWRGQWYVVHLGQIR